MPRKQQPNDPILRTVTRDLEVVLTDEEREAVGQEIAQLSAEIREQKTQSAGLKADIKSKEERRDARSDVYRSGKDTQPVECTERLVGRDVMVYRSDTGEHIDTRKATEQELQVDLNGVN